MEILRIFFGVLVIVGVIYGLAFIISAVICIPLWIKRITFKNIVLDHHAFPIVGQMGLPITVTSENMRKQSLFYQHLKELFFFGGGFFLTACILYLEFLVPVMLLFLWYFAFCFLGLFIYYVVRLPLALCRYFRGEGIFQNPRVQYVHVGYFTRLNTRIMEGLLIGLCCVLLAIFVQSPWWFIEAIVPAVLINLAIFYAFILGFLFFIFVLQVLSLCLFRSIIKTEN